MATTTRHTEVLDLIRPHLGKQQRDIAKLTGLGAANVSYHLRLARRDNELTAREYKLAFPRDTRSPQKPKRPADSPPAPPTAATSSEGSRHATVLALIRPHLGKPRQAIAQAIGITRHTLYQHLRRAQHEGELTAKELALLMRGTDPKWRTRLTRSRAHSVAVRPSRNGHSTNSRPKKEELSFDHFSYLYGKIETQIEYYAASHQLSPAVIAARVAGLLHDKAHG